MDNFKSSIREIEATYTKSEIVILCWHSKVQAYNLSKKVQTRNSPDKLIAMPSKGSGSNPNGITETDRLYVMPNGINKGVAIPKSFFDEEGQMDLRRATGPEAAAYLQHIGINLIVPHFA